MEFFNSRCDLELQLIAITWQVLLKNGADPDKRDAEGKTALEQV
jgi:hypothetical protein